MSLIIQFTILCWLCCTYKNSGRIMGSQPWATRTGVTFLHKKNFLGKGTCTVYILEINFAYFSDY